MCRLKSGIILKDDIFVPDYDSHTDMLSELEIADTIKNASTQFVRAELSPVNGDIFTDPATWEFKVDQDIRPKWFVEEYERERFVKVIKKWWSEHVFIGTDKLELKNSGTYYLKNCKDVTAWSNSNVKAYNNSNVEARGNSNVEARGNSNVTAHGNSNVEARGNSNVTLPPYSSNSRENIRVLENATLKDCKTRKIWVSGDYEVCRSEDVA